MKKTLPYRTLFWLFVTSAILFSSAISGHAQAQSAETEKNLKATWYDGTPAYYTCSSDHPSSGATAIVGYHTNDPHILYNTVYYIHINVFAVGDACGGLRTIIDIGLPENTTLAISETNKLFCFERHTASEDCPQSLSESAQNPGFYSIHSAEPDTGWVLAADENWEFQIPVISSSALVNSPFQAKVQIIDGNQDPWLNPVHKVSVAGPPITFIKSTPFKGAVNRPPSLTLKWSSSPNVASYQYCLKKTAGATCTSGWKSTGSNTFVTVNNLSSTRYFWQVRATNSYGKTFANNGTWWSFTVIPKPGAFSKTSPVDNAINRYTHPTLYWKASSNARSYEYCVDRVNDNKCGTGWRTTGTIRSASLNNLEHGETYYWQVRARNAAGVNPANAGAWWNFSVEP